MKMKVTVWQNSSNLDFEYYECYLLNIKLIIIWQNTSNLEDNAAKRIFAICDQVIRKV